MVGRTRLLIDFRKLGNFRIVNLYVVSDLNIKYSVVGDLYSGCKICRNFENLNFMGREEYISNLLNLDVKAFLSIFPGVK